MEIMFRWEEHNGHQNQLMSDYDGKNREHSITMIPCSASSSSPPTHPYMQHPISKLDTLPGIAIKYGVEVADIKKLNGLVTDHQMFALKMLHIPLPARHPPTYSPNDSSTPGELLEPFQSLSLKSSPAMTRVRSCNGTKLTMKKSISEIFDKAEYRDGGASNSSENGSFYRNSPMSKRPLSHLHKSRSLAGGILDEIFERCDIEPVVVDSGTWNEAKLLSKQNNRNSGGVSLKTGEGLALRQKASSRIAVTNGCESGGLNPQPINMRAALLKDGAYGGGVRKSSSTSCLHNQDKSSSSSRRGLKPDFQAFIAKPIFGGLPITVRKNKAALD